MSYEENNMSLYDAAVSGEYARVHIILLSEECDVNFRNRHKDGKTPLYIAASWGSMQHLAVIELLLEHNSDINLINDAFQTPLYVASSWGHLDVVNLLIQNNADINATNYEGRTALHIAAHISFQLNSYDQKRLRIIIDTAIRNVGTFLKKYVKYLPNLDDDYMKLWKTSKLSDFDEAANLAIFYNRFRVVAALIEAGANINVVDDNGETPLYMAKGSSHGSMIQFLLDNGAIAQPD